MTGMTGAFIYGLLSKSNGGECNRLITNKKQNV